MLSRGGCSPLATGPAGARARASAGGVTLVPSAVPMPPASKTAELQVQGDGDGLAGRGLCARLGAGQIQLCAWGFLSKVSSSESQAAG